MSFVNFPLLTYIAEISPRPLLLIAGDKAHSCYCSEDAYKAAAQPKDLMIVDDANHADLYDRLDKIPFDRISEFFGVRLSGRCWHHRRPQTPARAVEDPVFQDELWPDSPT